MDNVWGGCITKCFGNRFSIIWTHGRCFISPLRVLLSMQVIKLVQVVWNVCGRLWKVFCLKGSLLQNKTRQEASANPN